LTSRNKYRWKLPWQICDCIITRNRSNNRKQKTGTH